MIFESYACTGAGVITRQRSNYDTEKQRLRLVDQAKEDARQSPGMSVWIIEVENNGAKSYQLGD